MTKEKMMEEKTKKIGFGPATQKTFNRSSGRKVLLAIGVNQYRHWSGLNNAVRDAQQLAHVLVTKYNFETPVMLLNEQATRANIEEALYNFTQPDEIGEHDSLLIYYSGHGHLDGNNRGYWVPTDAEHGKVSTYFPNSRIRELISDIKCKHVLLISDACFAGAFFVRSGREEQLQFALASEYEKRPSRWAFCSGRHDEEVSDGPPGKHSPFARAILQELSMNDSQLNIAKLAERVIPITVANYREQLPEANPIQDVGHMGGQFVFSPQFKEDLALSNLDIVNEPMTTGSKKNTWLMVGIAALTMVVVLVAIWMSGVPDSQKTSETVGDSDSTALVSAQESVKPDLDTNAGLPSQTQPKATETKPKTSKTNTGTGIKSETNKTEPTTSKEQTDPPPKPKVLPPIVVVLTGVKATDEIWMQIKGGPEIKPEAGNSQFEVPARFKGQSATIYFNQTTCTKNLSLQSTRVQAPNCQ